MKGDLIFKILAILESAVFTTADLIDVFTSSYSESYRKARKLMLYGPSHQKSLVDSLQNAYQKNQRFYNLLYRLQKDGLIEKNKSNDKRKTCWLITKKGKEKIKELKESKEKNIPKKDYPVEKDDNLKIVIFDIPEKHRNKRNWLRENLIRLEFSILQKSVWIGKAKLPQEFIKDIKELEILPYVEIFSVNKIGSIKQLK